MTSTASHPTLLDLAKQGNAYAIGALMNRGLQPKGITAKAALLEGCLQIMLESAEVPNQQALVAFVRKGLTSLGAVSIERVMVYGRQTGTNVPAWSQEFGLRKGQFYLLDSQVETENQTSTLQVERLREQPDLPSSAKEVRSFSSKNGKISMTPVCQISKHKTKSVILGKAIDIIQKQIHSKMAIGLGTCLVLAGIWVGFGVVKKRVHATVPLSNLKLEPLLVKSEDLPNDLLAGKLEYVAPLSMSKLPVANKTIHQYFERNGEVKGGVVVLLYESNSSLEQAYNLVIDGMGESQVSAPPKPGTIGEMGNASLESEQEQLTNIGNQATMGRLSVSMFGNKKEFIQLNFVRCHALVSIRMGDTSDVTAISNYAKKLDERLTTLVCREPQVKQTKASQLPLSLEPIDTPSPLEKTTEAIPYSDPKQVQIADNYYVDLTTIKDSSNGLLQVIGGSYTSKDEQFLYAVDCKSKNMAPIAIKSNAYSNEWIPMNNIAVSSSPDFAELICNY
jgi:hypothetical protein